MMTYSFYIDTTNEVLIVVFPERVALQKIGVCAGSVSLRVSYSASRDN